MVFEATIICIDNSEWMRNGDYRPTRIVAQADAVLFIAGAKMLSNPTNQVGILKMAGKGARILANTTDVGKVLESICDVEIGGEVDMKTAIEKAQLALKHRQNKNQQQRIVVFAGSPVKHDKETLELVGQKLKKNNVALDIVNFGEQDDGKTEKLEALLAAVNNNENSLMAYIPPSPDPDILTDVLMSTPIMNCGEGAARDDFELDLRLSMEEERARLRESMEAAAKRDAEESSDVSMFADEADVSMVSKFFEWLTLDDAAKDDKNQPDTSKDLKDQSFMSSDVQGADPNDPSENDQPASVQNESEPEEKKKEEKSPSDEK